MPVLVMLFTLIVALILAFAAGHLAAGVSTSNPRRSIRRSDSARAALSRASQVSGDLAERGPAHTSRRDLIRHG